VLAFSSEVYDTLKFLHIAGAVVWVGSGLYFQYAGTRLRRAGDAEAFAAFAKQVVAATPLMIGSSVSVLVAGLALVLYAPGLDFTDAWIVLGLVGYAATFVTGTWFIRPRAERLAELIAAEGPAAAATQAAVAQIFAISRVDQVVLLAVIAVMVFKPGA
jgi:uncharacterized membrane protein